MPEITFAVLLLFIVTESHIKVKSMNVFAFQSQMSRLQGVKSQAVMSHILIVVTYYSICLTVEMCVCVCVCSKETKLADV